MASFRFEHTGDHLKAGVAETLHPPPATRGSGSVSATTTLRMPALITASVQGGAAVVATGLQGDHDRAAAGGFAGLCQSPHLGMGLTGAGMEPSPTRRPEASTTTAPTRGLGLVRPSARAAS